MAFLRCFHGILTLLKWHSYIASTAFKHGRFSSLYFALLMRGRKFGGMEKRVYLCSHEKNCSDYPAIVELGFSDANSGSTDHSRFPPEMGC